MDGKEKPEETTYAGERVYVGITCVQVLQKGRRLLVSRDDGKPVRFERRAGCIYIVGDWAMENLDVRGWPA